MTSTIIADFNIVGLGLKNVFKDVFKMFSFWRAFKVIEL